MPLLSNLSLRHYGHVSPILEHDIDCLGIELAPTIAVGTDNPAFVRQVTLRPALRFTSFISSCMTVHAKQLDIFRKLVSEGTIMQVVELQGNTFSLTPLAPIAPLFDEFALQAFPLPARNEQLIAIRKVTAAVEEVIAVGSL